jgi:hypothetical protein
MAEEKHEENLSDEVEASSDEVERSDDEVSSENEVCYNFIIKRVLISSLEKVSAQRQIECFFCYVFT